ncbi:MAG: hypothetical protein AAGA06_11065 [Pseudomonadota bacterium]
MSATDDDVIPTSHTDALQAISVMAGVLVFATVIWQDRPNVLLAVFSFCILFMTLVTTTLCLIEARVVRDKPNPLLRFCLPGTALLGCSGALFLACGFWVWAVLTLVMAAALSLYRRQAADGAFGLIPAAGHELGLVGGLGAVVAGALLVAIKLIA